MLRVQEFGGIGQAGLDGFLTDMRIVVQDLLMGPPAGKKVDDELDGEPCALDDRLADKDLGVDRNAFAPVHFHRFPETSRVACRRNRGPLNRFAFSIPQARLRLRCFGRYCEVMSRQTVELLEAFDALPAEEKRIFTAEFFRRAVPFDSGPLDDDETTHAADAIFAMLDAEDDDAPSR